MAEQIITALLWFCAIGCGIIGGLFFAFSTFIMTALGQIAPRAGADAMNAINVVILRSMFMPVFFGTTLASLALAVVAVIDLDRPGAAAMGVAGAIYVVGMFVCTMAFNVPRNNALARAPETEVEAVWARYLKEWTAWNHVRTIASVLASALFTVAIAAQ